MTKVEKVNSPNPATVSNPIKKKRQFTWTEKRKAQFAKLAEINKARRESKRQLTETHQKETVAEDNDEVENRHAQKILKRIMDPHYLSKSVRTEPEEKEKVPKETIHSESESSSSEEEVDSEPEMKPQIPVKNVPVKDEAPEREEILKSRKLLGKYEILKAKNKQLEKLIIASKLKKAKQQVVPPVVIPASPEPVSKKPKKETQQEYNAKELRPHETHTPSFYFC